MNRSNYEYKESGVEWLGEIPDHWKVKPLKRVCAFAYGDSLPDDNRCDGHIPVYGSNGVVGFHNESNTLAPSIVVGRKGSYGKINYSLDKAFAIDTAYYIDAKSSAYDIRWLYYALQCLKLDEGSKDSAVPGLAREDAYKHNIPDCNLLEQQAIASFLDQETARIDVLIQKKERMIELLKEKRIALITQAVTKGLDPNVPMKDSGIEWLGEVPEHWGVKRVKRVCSFAYGGSLSDDNRNDGQIPVYGSNGVVGYHDKSNTSAPSIIVGRKGSYGKLNYSRDKAFAIDTTYYIDGSTTYNDIRWLLYALMILRLDEGSKDSAVPGLAREDAYNLNVPVCSVYEQQVIASFLDNETDRIDFLRNRIQTSISLLREYRASLIHHAVTGKIDLRGYDAQA